MRKPRLFLNLSWMALITSIVAVAASTSTNWSWIVPLLMWNHLLIIVVFAVAIFQIRKLPKVPWSDVLRGLPRWLLAVGIVCALLAAPNWSSSTFDLGKTDTGEVITRKNWYAEGDKYYLKLNNSVTKQITKNDYEELQRGNYEFFARTWVIFSFCCLAFWLYIKRRLDATQNAS
jgi:hypothetical protein